MILTYNEEANIGRCLQSIPPVSRILVIDSGSTDRTVKIAKNYPRVDVVERQFDDFASQCNFGLSRIDSTWVLSLDADYVLSHKFQQELRELDPGLYNGYSASFVYRVFGRPLRASLYPARKVLYRRGLARYQNEGHGHRVIVDGAAGLFRSEIFHDDRKPLSRWFASQQKYAKLEANHLLEASPSDLHRIDRIRRMAWPAPVLVFLYTLLIKRCLFDGWPGWYYVLQRTLAEIMLGLEIIDRYLKTNIND